MVKDNMEKLIEARKYTIYIIIKKINYFQLKLVI